MQFIGEQTFVSDQRHSLAAVGRFSTCAMRRRNCLRLANGDRLVIYFLGFLKLILFYLGHLDRVLTGIVAEEVLFACQEQMTALEAEEDSSADQAFAISRQLKGAGKPAFVSQFIQLFI